MLVKRVCEEDDSWRDRFYVISLSYDGRSGDAAETGDVEPV